MRYILSNYSECKQKNTGAKIKVKCYVIHEL